MPKRIERLNESDPDFDEDEELDEEWGEVEEPAEDVRLAKLKERKEPTLGELNPLLFPPDILNDSCVEALKLVINKLTSETGGRQPVAIGSTSVVDERFDRHPRFTAKFEVDQLSEAQMQALEELTAVTYAPMDVRTRIGLTGSPMVPTRYVGLEKRTTKSKESGYLGWYMGPDAGAVNNTHSGLFIYRDIGQANLANYFRHTPAKTWFLKDKLMTPTGKKLKSHFVLEVREAGLFQTDLVEFIVQIGAILSDKQAPLEDPQLLYKIYNELNRLGLRSAGQAQIYGLEQQMDQIQRGLLTPLANINLSHGIALRPSSVLLIGVPGTGKTELVKNLMLQDTGVFILPLDPKELEVELADKAEKRNIIPRINSVFAKTGIPVVLHMEDIENITTDEKQINSTLLNLMKGVRERGFFVIASTNKPEQFNPQLLQPERFGNIVYFPLQDATARYGILDAHATAASLELKRPLFASEQQRSLILQAIASDDRTKNYTPRFLADIATSAKSWYLTRLREKTKQTTGLTEADIPEKFTFEIKDWENALAEIDTKYNKAETIKRDDEIARFAKNHHSDVGFTGKNGEYTRSLQADVNELSARLQLRQTKTGSDKTK